LPIKELNMLVWLTQLGISVTVPLAAFTLAGLWLRERFRLGAWIVIVFCALGFLFAVKGFCQSMKLMALMEKNANRKKDPPPVSFNDHE